MTMIIVNVEIMVMMIMVMMIMVMMIMVMMIMMHESSRHRGGGCLPGCPTNFPVNCIETIIIIISTAD